jgi:hypothetical protein
MYGVKKYGFMQHKLKRSQLDFSESLPERYLDYRR